MVRQDLKVFRRMVEKEGYQEILGWTCVKKGMFVKGCFRRTAKTLKNGEDNFTIGAK